jgi:CubicO group peptidase (beta-lactamase class C family)
LKEKLLSGTFKRLFRPIFFCILGLAGGLVLIWLLAHLFTGDSQWARSVAWMDSDVGDVNRFPFRVLAIAPPSFDFQNPPPSIQKRYTPAFAPLPYPPGSRTPVEISKFLKETDTAAFLVIKDDLLLREEYSNGYDHSAIVTSFSVAKSFVSALVGIAIHEGYIAGVEDPITKYVPELLQKDPRYKKINLRHLLSMSSGIRYKERSLPWSDDSAVYYSPDLRATAVSSPIAGDPGKAFLYNNFHPLLLGLVLERSTKRPVSQYLEEKIWKPLGMEAPGSWSLDSERSRFEKLESGINGRAVDFAKFGRLFLNRGNWNGKQIIPPAWVDESTRLDTTTDPAPNYQYMWWVNARVVGKHHFFAAGKHGQYIYLIPEQNLMFVRFGKTDPFRHWVDFFEILADRMAGL